MSTVVPHKFTSAKTISPNQVNENARALWRAFKRLEAKRYNHFIIHADMAQLETGDGSVEGQFIVDLDFPYDIVAAELIGYGGEDLSAGSATGTEAITLTCSDSGFEDLSVTVDHDSVGTQKRDFKAQSLSVSATGAPTFTVSIPTASNAEVTAQVNLVCRYDLLSEASYTLPDPPSVASGESYEVTEWNTWFSSMATAIQALENLYDARKRAGMVMMARNTNPTAYSPPDDDCYAIFGGGGEGTTFSANGAMISDANLFVGAYNLQGAGPTSTEIYELSNNDLDNGGTSTLEPFTLSVGANQTPGFGTQANTYHRVDHDNQSNPQDIRRLFTVFAMEG